MKKQNHLFIIKNLTDSLEKTADWNIVMIVSAFIFLFFTFFLLFVG